MSDPLPQNIPDDDESDTDTSSSTLSSFSSVSTTRDALEDLDLHIPKTRTFTFSKYTFQEIVPSSDMKPKPRSGHRIVHYKGRIYSFGGYNPLIDGNDPDMAADQFWAESKPLFKELWELNLSTREWTKCEMRGEVPEQLASHTAINHPGQPSTMIIYGGTGAPFGLTTSNTVVTCDLDTQTFSQLELDETDFGQGWPMPLYGQAVTSDNGRMFTVGGTSGFTYFMDVHMLDFRVCPPQWSCLYRLSGVRDEPEPRYRHELALWEDKLYVLGGGTSFSANRFEDLPTFCVPEKRWYYTRTKPDPQATIDNVSILLFLTKDIYQNQTFRVMTGIQRRGDATAQCRSRRQSGYSGAMMGRRCMETCGN